MLMLSDIALVQIFFGGGGWVRGLPVVTPYIKVHKISLPESCQTFFSGKT